MRAKKLTQVFLLCLLLVLLPTAVLAAEASDFSDMPAVDHWSYEALNSAVENSLLHGSNGKLDPRGVLTRAQMAAIINRAFGATEEADISTYTDVPLSAWYYEDIAKAVRMGTFRGDGSGIMRPNDSITRQEAFVVLARAFKLSGGDVNVLDGFSDKDQISAWATDASASLAAAGYIQGSNNKLNPKNPLPVRNLPRLCIISLKHIFPNRAAIRRSLPVILSSIRQALPCAMSRLTVI